MMEGFADLLTDAFSESSVPSFPMGDLDFENLCFDEKSEEEEEEQTENLMTETDEAQLQEASAEGAALLEGPAADALNIDENAYEEQIDEENDEEDFRGVRFGSKTPEDDDCSSSDGEEEQKVFCSGKDEEEEAESPEEEGDALMSICGSDVLDSKKKAGILDDVDELQVSNKLQEEEDSDEEEDGCRNEKIVRSDESEEEDEEEEEEEGEEDSSESDYEGMKTEENFLSEETEKPYLVDPADSGLEFPSISFQNLQDLISEVDGEVYEEKMSDFTGEEHQEAGESFADYPSDFSSGEHGRNPVNAESASPRPREEECLERAVTESHSSEEAAFLFSRDIEMNAGKMMSLNEAAGEEDERKSEHLLSVMGFDDEEKTSESDSYSSSDDDEPLRSSNDGFSFQSRTLEDDSKLENIKLQGGSDSDDRNAGHDRYDPAEFLSSGFGGLESNTFLNEYLLTAEDTDGRESPPSGMNQCLDEDVNSYSVVQREETKPASPFIQGSIDDSFFFNSEPNDFTEDGQQEEEDEYEERRNFEQMKQRIEAFKKFYDNSDDENGREERQIKVQFCADPLSQVNYYETDSSDRESISSSSDREEDPSPAEQSDEPKEPEEDLNIKPVCGPPVVQQHQSPADIVNTQTSTETRKSLSTLKLIVTLGVLTATGLMMFGLTTDQPEWLRQFFFF